MAFLSKTDYFGLAGNGLVCVSQTENKSQNVVEAMDDKGSIVASEAYGETYAPSNSYVVKSTVSETAGGITLGNVTSHDGVSYVLNSFAINTTAGGAASVEASGESVELSATANCTYPIPEFSLPVTHHAHILFDAFSLSGTGCYL